MARMRWNFYESEWNGPYPHHAGDYCGNHKYGMIHNYHTMFCRGQWRKEKRAYEMWLSKMRFGIPHSCCAGTADQLKAKGVVGLYLNRDSKSTIYDVPVPTPYKLTEWDHPEWIQKLFQRYKVQKAYPEERLSELDFQQLDSYMKGLQFIHDYNKRKSFLKARNIKPYLEPYDGIKKMTYREAERYLKYKKHLRDNGELSPVWTPLI